MPAAMAVYQVGSWMAQSPQIRALAQSILQEIVLPNVAKLYAKNHASGKSSVAPPPFTELTAQN
jgi:hypothetical protein